MYAAPAWWGYTNAGERDRLEGFIRKTKRFGYLPPSALTAEEMSERADDNLFKAVMSDCNHVLHACYPLLAPTNTRYARAPTAFCCLIRTTETL